jgi:uncharacterized protein with HEPN domain
MPDDPATILDIVPACRRVGRFVRHVDERGFRADDEKRWAVVSQSLIIGEAVRRLSDKFRESMPDVPWKRMAAMRNRLIHEYDKINWALVWKTARTEVPQLQSALQGLVEPGHGQAG